MKKLLFCAFMMCLFVVGNAQNSDTFNKVSLVTAELTAQYNLTNVQQREVRKVVEVQQENLEQIASLQSTTPQAYLAKKRSIREYLEGKLSQILVGPQLSILKKTQADRQVLERQIRKKMKGASQEELQLALLEMEK